MSVLPGHNSGHSEETQLEPQPSDRLQTSENEGEESSGDEESGSEEDDDDDTGNTPDRGLTCRVLTVSYDLASVEQFDRMLNLSYTRCD